MAFLDSKEDLLVIILTEHGRELLSKDGLKIKYYTFFDDEVDYEMGAGFSVSSSNS